MMSSKNNKKSNVALCSIDQCPGTEDSEPESVCHVCGAPVHDICWESHIRSSSFYPSEYGSHPPPHLCSSTCCLLYGSDDVDFELVKARRVELVGMTKPVLKKAARDKNVRVTHRVDGKSRDVPKNTMVQKLLEVEFIMQSESGANSEMQGGRTIHDKFRLVNVLFSDELGSLAASSSNVATCQELDSGNIGADSMFWKTVEKRFNDGFPGAGADGLVFADKVHFSHPLFDSHQEVINPGVHGTFDAKVLRKTWKVIQAEYDTVMTKFTRSGNHNSNFTKAAMRAINQDKENDNEDSGGGSSSLAGSTETEEDDDDFGMEERGFCQFTNSLVIVYLRMWLNERPGLNGFVSRKIPAHIQVDSMGGISGKRAIGSETSSLDKMRKKQSSGELLFDAMNNLAQAKWEETKARQDDISRQLQMQSTLQGSVGHLMKCASESEEIKLLDLKLAMLYKKHDACDDPDQLESYKSAIEAIERQQDYLLIGSDSDSPVE